MKPSKAVVALLTAGFLLPAVPAFAQFSGYFAGYYAPTNWASSTYNNPTWAHTAFVYGGLAPNSLEIDGAVDSLQQVQSNQPPVSIIDYTIVLSGSGLQPVAFNYSFTGANDGLDGAAVIYGTGGSNAVFATLPITGGAVQTFSGTFMGGETIGFRVYSNNDNVADVLLITPVPEPSPVALAGLGGVALVWNARRRLFRR